MRHAGYYALLQYGSIPERQEFLNFGVFLAVPELGFAEVMISDSSVRIERFFDGVPKARFDAVKHGFGNRVKIEYSRHRSARALEEFSSRLANEFRLSEVLPVAVDQPFDVLKKLFIELVGDERPSKRNRRISARLKDEFVSRRIVQYLDSSPKPVRIPEAGVEINAPFGYQNGAYNLIDGVRISGNPSEDMKETGRRAMEGGLLWKHYAHLAEKKRLVVVGDFSKHSDNFYDAVGDLLEENHVRLYRLDNLDPLIQDISENARLHG